MASAPARTRRPNTKAPVREGSMPPHNSTPRGQRLDVRLANLIARAAIRAPIPSSLENVITDWAGGVFGSNGWSRIRAEREVPDCRVWGRWRWRKRTGTITASLSSGPLSDDYEIDPWQHPRAVWLLHIAEKSWSCEEDLIDLNRALCDVRGLAPDDRQCP